MIRWTPEKQCELEALVEAGKTQFQIAEEMGTSPSAITKRILFTDIHRTPPDLLRARWTAIIPAIKAALRAEIEAMSP